MSRSAQPRGGPRRSQPQSAHQPALPDVLAIQRGRFVQWQPSPVICSAVTGDGTVAAVGREDGQIELWDTLSWQLLKWVPGSEQSTLSTLAWVEETQGHTRQLVSGGLDGSLTEWELTTLHPQAVTDSYGGAVWALAVQPSPQPGEPPHLAVACDDGVLRLFGSDETGPGMHYRKSFGRVEGRVLSIAWHPSGKTLVSGHSEGCIRAWDVASTREIYRITAGKSSCVWAVLVLPDGTLVSGESSGHLRFWDGRFGTLLTEFREHKADVLTLAASPAGDAVWAAGVDPRVAMFSRATSAPGTDSWLYIDSKRPHTHDVRTLLTLTSAGEAPLLLSGGNDAQLLAHSVDAFTQLHPTRVCRIPQRPITAAASPGPDSPVLLLSAHGADVDLWRLPAASQGDGHDSSSSAPAHVARISNKSGRHILAAALSPDGRTAAFSDAYQLKVFDIAEQSTAAAASQSAGSSQSGVAISRRHLPDGTPPAHHLAFTANGWLVAVSASGRVDLIDLGSGKLLRSFTEAADAAAAVGSEQRKSWAARVRQQPPVAALAVSGDGTWLATAVAGTMQLFSLADLQHRGHIMLPGEAMVALAFSPDSGTLAAATASKTVHVFDMATRRPAPWMAANGDALQRSLDKLPGPILGISFSPSQQASALLVSMPNAFAHLDLKKDLGTTTRKRRRQKEHLSPDDAALLVSKVDNFKAAKLDHPCLLLTYTGPAVAVLLEHDWTDVWTQLPAPMYRHRFGT